MLAESLVAGVYERSVDRDSAYEKLKGRAARSIGSSVGRELSRGVLGGLLGSGSRRR